MDPFPNQSDDEFEDESNILNGIHDRIILVNPGDKLEIEYFEKMVKVMTESIPELEACKFEPKEGRPEGSKEGVAKPLVELIDEIEHISAKEKKFMKENSLEKHEAYQTRHRMENLLLEAFKHNMCLNEKGLLDRFVHVISVDRLMILIAEEFLETDLIRMFDSMRLFKRITIWQVILSAMTIIFVAKDIVFGEIPQFHTDYKSRCENYWYETWLNTTSWERD